MGDFVRREIDVDAERRKDIGGTGARGQRAITVLGDGDAGASDNQRCAGGNIERARRVAAGPNHVDGVRRRLDAEHLAAHRGDSARNLVDGFAAHAQRHQQRAHLRRRRFAGHHLAEGGGGFLAAERGAGRHLADQALERVGHGIPLN